MPLIVGLTGGVASGKSEVSRRFAELGAPVFDADECARELVAPGQPALREIVDAFGAQILGQDGRLDRRALREIVFDDPERRGVLERLLHPRIEAWLRTAAFACAAPYVIVVVPLLAEVGRYPWLDCVVAIAASPELQMARLMARDGISLELAQRMLSSQVSVAERRALADREIRNFGSLPGLRTQVERLDRALRRVAVLRDRWREQSGRRRGVAEPE